ncbi:unnamed protein product [Urochloa humidicola]
MWCHKAGVTPLRSNTPTCGPGGNRAAHDRSHACRDQIAKLRNRRLLAQCLLRRPKPPPPPPRKAQGRVDQHLYGDSTDIVGWIRERLRSNSGVEELLDAGVGGRVDHVREEMLLVLRIAMLCTAKSPKDRPTMRDVVTMLGEAKPSHKSSSATVAATVVDKDKPVFMTSPDSGYL